MPYMDETPTVPGAASDDRFTETRFSVVPEPAVQAALKQPVTKQLLVTDAGFFPHAHRHECERPEGAREHIFLICTAGSGHVHTPAGRTNITKGDAVLLPAGLPHEYRADQDDPWTLWWFHTVGPDADELFASAISIIDGYVAHLRDTAAIAALTAQVIEALDTSTNGGLVRASGAAWHVLTHVISAGKRPTSDSIDAVDMALEHLQRISPERVSVEELAALAELSTSQFSALFKQRVGVPPLRYQNDLRLARARELLATTEIPIAEIATHCGYDDPLYFSRQFARTHGHSPSSYRSRFQ